MKTIMVCLFLLPAIIPGNLYGQAPPSTNREIMRMEELERAAAMKGDTAALFKLWAPDYVVNNPNNMILTSAQIKVFTRKGGMDSSSFSRTIEKIVFTRDMAIVMGNETVAPKNKSDNAGKPLNRRFTNIWIKTDTGWLLSARQATNMLMQ